MDPDVLVHYIAACAVAHVSPADVSSTFKSACEMRELVAKVAALSIPDAAKLLRARVS